MKSLLIFDCDGVLVDSEIISSRIAAQMISNLGFPITAEQCLRRFTGMSGEDTHRLLEEEGGISIPKDFPQQVDPLISEAYEKELQPLIKPLLEQWWLQQLPKCIASNNPLRRVVKALQVTDQEQFFHQEHIFTAELVPRGKPSPDLFLLAAARMGVRPQNALIIEDSLAGIEAAQRAGMEAIGFLGATHAQYPWYQEKMMDRASQIASNLEELIEMLQKKFNYFNS